MSIRPTLDILCFNIWNTNPPAWLIHDTSKRWGWYFKRMDHFADLILETKAPIIALQEVRYDSTTGADGDHSQITHLTQRLPDYQFVFQPAMLYYNRETADPLERVEEGPMILSQYPIIHSDFVLLSRNTTDRDDVHQRVCLHAVIEVPQWGLVDIFTAHLSLSEPAREQSMVGLFNWI